MNSPEVLGVVEVLEVDKAREQGGGKNECPQILSENPVRLEEPIILLEERQHFAPSGQVKNGKPTTNPQTYHETAVTNNPLVTALSFSAW